MNLKHEANKKLIGINIYIYWSLLSLAKEVSQNYASFCTYSSMYSFIKTILVSENPRKSKNANQVD